MMEGLSKAFKVGYDIRTKYVKSVKDKAAAELNDVPELEKQLATLTKDLDGLKSYLEAEESLEKEERRVKMTEVFEKLMKVTGLHGISSIGDSLEVLRATFDVLGLSTEDIKKLNDDDHEMSNNVSGEAVSPPVSDEEDLREEGLDDISEDAPHHYSSYDDQDGYGHADEERAPMHTDDYSEAAVEQQAAETETASANPSETAVETKSTSCNLGVHSTVCVE